MAEVIVPPSSDLVGTVDRRGQISDAFRADGHRPQARQGRASTASSRNEKLKVGDTLLLVGPWSDIEQTRDRQEGPRHYQSARGIEEVLPVPGKALQAVVCLVLVVGLMVSGLVPNVQAALIGCLLMGALGCVDLNSAYRSIDWKTIVLIVGMLPFSIALQRTGGVDLAADALHGRDRRRRTARRPCGALCDHRAARHVHLQHGDGGADGAGRYRGRGRLQRLALSLRDDRRAGRLHRFHDAGLVAGEHARGRPGNYTSGTSCGSACRSRSSSSSSA